MGDRTTVLWVLLGRRREARADLGTGGLKLALMRDGSEGDEIGGVSERGGGGVAAVLTEKWDWGQNQGSTGDRSGGWRVGTRERTQDKPAAAPRGSSCGGASKKGSN